MRFLIMGILIVLLFFNGNSSFANSVFPVAALPQQTIEALQKLEDNVLASLEQILDDKQEEILKEGLSKGTLRKAFKQINLTEAQRTQVGDIFKILPQSEEFMSLTPEQKKQFFMRKKELFIPSAEEIASKVKQNMESIGTKKGFVPSTGDILQKVEEKMKIKEGFIPSKEEIYQKINQGLEIKEQFMENSGLNGALRSVDQLIEEKLNK